MFTDGRAKFFIPLEYVKLDAHSIEDMKSLQTQELLRTFISQDKEADFHLLRFFDVGTVSVCVVSLLAYYEQWLGRISMPTGLRFALGMTSVWRSVAFIDADPWAQHVRQLGLPVVDRASMTVPEGVEGGLMLDFTEGLDTWLVIVSVIVGAFGLPTDLVSYILANRMLQGA